MHEVGLADLLPHLVERVQCGKRILEDHRNVATAMTTHLFVLERRELDAVKHHRTGRFDSLAEVQTHQGIGRHRLARTALAHDADRLTWQHVERHAVDSFHNAVLGVECHTKVAHRKQCLTRHQLRTRGSRNP